MQVLGYLIRLPESSTLPLPWWERAPLGFLHGTRVYVALVSDMGRPVGDILISTLDLNKWHNTLRLDCNHKDEQGVVFELMDAVFPLNIVLAETVTTEAGNDHHATLFCQDHGEGQVRDVIPRIKDLLLAKRFQDITIVPHLSQAALTVLRSAESDIDHGWLRGIDYRNWITQEYPSGYDQVDLSRAVVSADTETRILRFIFPRRGAQTVRVVHNDQPGSLREIFRAFRDSRVNVLSTLLRRGGQTRGRAELVAVGEPAENHDTQENFRSLESLLGKVDQKYGLEWKLDTGLAPDRVTFSRAPHLRPEGKRPICLLCPGRPTARTAELLRAVREGLSAHGYYPLEMDGSTKPGADARETQTALLARSDAVILLSTEPTTHGDERLALEIVYSLGIADALTKPLLLLTDRGAGPRVAFETSSRVTIAPLSEGAAALRPDDPASVAAKLRGWIDLLQFRA